LSRTIAPKAPACALGSSDPLRLVGSARDVGHRRLQAGSASQAALALREDGAARVARLGALVGGVLRPSGACVAHPGARFALQGAVGGAGSLA
jgi:hypothetical protein